MSGLRNINTTKNVINPESHNIIELIFSFLMNRRKLIIINYNKELQNLISVNIEDYKNSCVRFKVGGRNGKGKEYSLATNKLVFEGEYLNGKRNGKGKEYDEDGNILYESEYLNGKKMEKQSNIMTVN